MIVMSDAAMNGTVVVINPVNSSLSHEALHTRKL
jgi:hypothetical protein